MIAVWQNDPGGANRVMYSIFTAPSTWTTPVVISTGVVDSTVKINIGCDKDTGTAIAVWRGVQNTMAVVFDPNTNKWSAEQPIGPNNIVPVDNSSIDLCFASDGNCHILTRTFNQLEITPQNFWVEAATYNAATGTFIQPPSQLAYQNITPVPWSDPQVCCSVCGDAYATWGDLLTGDVYFAQFRGDLQQWQPANPNFALGSDPANLRPNLTCDSNGSIFPIYNQFLTFGNGIMSTEGYCGRLVNGPIEAGLQVNRFPFQTECGTCISWNIYGCLTGIVLIHIEVNGVLERVIPGPISKICLPLLQSGDVVTITPCG